MVISDDSAELDPFSEACRVYRERYSARPLSDQELLEAMEYVTDIRSGALRLMPLWEELVTQLPGEADLREAADEVMFQSPHPRRPISQFRSALNANDISTSAGVLMSKFSQAATSGDEILRNIRPALSYAQHYQRECGRETRGELVRRQTLQVADSAVLEVELLEHRLKGDVESQRSQVEALNIVVQVGLSRHLRQLTQSVAALTALLIAITVLVLLATVFSVIF